MAYLLRHPFAEISVVADDDTMGRVSHSPPGEWFRPDIEVDGRTRNLIEDHMMICLAGAETEAAWYRRQPADAPDGWEERVNIGSRHDWHAAVNFGDYVCGGSVPELEAYVNGCGSGCSATPADPWPKGRSTPRSCAGSTVATRVSGHSSLADAVQEAGTLRWRKARGILREADGHWLDSSIRPVSRALDDLGSKPLTWENRVSEGRIATYVHIPDRADH